MSTPSPRIPYGEADFRRIRLNQWLYVDKTRFVRPLENESYAFLIRPRRFGKTCWLSLLQNYYDRNGADEHEAIFGGTDIGRNPTESRHRYVVLRFNFSAFDDALETLQERFETYCATVLRHTLERNKDLLSQDEIRRILAPPAIDGKLNELFLYASDQRIPLFMLVDEYDNFANTVLAHHGEKAYRSLTHGGGFYRNFFATLKAGTEQSHGGLERLFITGVSPITMDDVTSGFNIGSNISLRTEFNELLGFTEAEVRSLLALYQERGVFVQDVDAVLDVMREWYDGYRFAKATANSVYNTDMVLYFLKESIANGSMTDELIDANVRIDYGKLRHLLIVNRQLNGNFDQLQELTAEQQVSCDVQRSFPLEELNQPENFLSLLYYFGLLSFRGVERGMPRLAIPNQTVKQLMYGYLRAGFRDAGVVSVNLFQFSRLVREMAYDGAWRPALEFLGSAIADQTTLRDYLGSEKVVQGFLAAYLNVTNYYQFHSEYELNKGFADIFLEPILALFPDLPFGYVIELEYLKRSDDLNERRLAAARQEADIQLRQYLQDERLPQRYPGVRFIGLIVVFHGWQLVACDAIDEVAEQRQAP